MDVFNKEEVDDLRVVNINDFSSLFDDIDRNRENYTPWFKSTLVKLEKSEMNKKN